MAAKRTSTPRSKARTAARRPAATASFEATRARLDKKRAKRRAKMLWVHYWLLCPKCGGDMFVQETLGIRYEVCRDCHGIAIDGEEAALLLEHLDAEKALKAILKKSRKPDTKEI
jgi:Zn-finger nucleic acid-binding protein